MTADESVKADIHQVLYVLMQYVGYIVIARISEMGPHKVIVKVEAVALKKFLPGLKESQIALHTGWECAFVADIRRQRRNGILRIKCAVIGSAYWRIS